MLLSLVCGFDRARIGFGGLVTGNIVFFVVSSFEGGIVGFCSKVCGVDGLNWSPFGVEVDVD
jgi:hypothetical protein